MPKRKSTMIISLILLAAHIGGFLTSIRAIMEVRTSQGAIAWAVSLNTFPVIALPAYWVLGRSKFSGYVNVRRSDLMKSEPLLQALEADLEKSGLTSAFNRDQARLLENIAKLPFTTGNKASLLIDGEATFNAILERIASAKHYVLVQFYILRDDDLGRRLQDALIERAKQGVKCYVVYDEVGYKPGPAYHQAFKDAGITCAPFNTRQGEANRFQINFRNHRKIVVVDGRSAFVGGHNVGDEYLGKHPTLSPWRDTHVEVSGPVVQCVQLSFAEDWYWATGEILDQLDWTTKRVEDGTAVALCLPSGPADEFETATLFFLHAINRAQKRLWIASPYFVPDEQIVSALQSAALRGVDVQILIPQNPDNWMVMYSAFSYLPELEKAGIQVSRYQPGFMHQKVMLVDDAATIGTANFDNRSFRLNFEVTMVIVDPALTRDVEAMLLADFARSKPLHVNELTDASFFFRLKVRICRLMSPLQ